MDMSIPVASASPKTSSNLTATVSGAGQTNAKSGAGGFQQTLVYQINGKQQAASAATQNEAATPVLGLTIATDAAGTLDNEEAADLIDVIDELIGQLQEMDESLDAGKDESDLSELEAMLDQINALLALLGAPVLPAQPVLGNVNDAQGEQASAEQEQPLTTVKNSLQDSLFQLMTLVQEGSLKRVQQQEPTRLIAQQLNALQQLLQQQQEDSTLAKSAELTKQAADFVPAPNGAQPTASVSALLQRLTQASVHPSLLAAAAQDSEADASGDNVPVEGNEVVHPLQAATSFNELIRTSTQNTAAKAVMQPYVLADQFAESMTGLLVQKFELSSLKGVSEAKIQLFPEQLGQVDVRIMMQNGQLTAVFNTETPGAKEMLDSQMAQLRAALQAQGLTVDKLEVTYGQTAAQLAGGQQGSGQQAFSNQSKSKGERMNDDAGFESDVVEQLAVQELGYGRAVNVTA